MESAFYRSRLPHIVPPYATFFITFRLAGSLPASIVYSLKAKYEKLTNDRDGENQEEKELRLSKLRKSYFKEFDDQLDKKGSGPTYLNNSEIAACIKNELEKYNGDYYDLQAYCIMPNHVHLLLDTSIQEYSLASPIRLDKILKRLKGSSAIKANRLLERTGSFWQKESYDHLVRNQTEWHRIYGYILNNPYKAGLVENFSNWPYLFGCNES